MAKLLAVCLAAYAALAASGAETQSPYGICAHVTRSLRSEHRLKGTLDAMALAGIRSVRSDFDSYSMRKKDGTWDFSNYDALLDALEARGVQLLPILYSYEKRPSDLAKHRDYVRTVVSRYARRLPVIEVWNEANLNGFFPGADPVAYAEVLKATYEEIRRIDPSIRVAYTGTAGVPLDWIRQTFLAGATNCFDILCVHPYSHPARPEGALDVKLEKLRQLMAEFGLVGKSVWITELGWPTHRKSVPFLHVLQAGLKVARPGQKTWRAVLAENQVDGEIEDQSLAQEILEILPAGSSVVACSQRETVRRLAAGGVDAVIYPFDESYPADTAQAVNAFVRSGGVLVDFGGVPCYFGRRDGEAVAGLQHGGGLGQFPFGYRAWWTDRVRKTYPECAGVFATDAGLAAGVKQEPTGFRATRFLAPDRAGPGAEWIPLVAGKATNGTELVAAAVIRYRDGRRGAAVLSTLSSRRGVLGTNTEENQARYTARALGITFAEGVEATFPYSLVAGERDPFYSEDHFGIMHADFTPKPAYAAYGQFVRMRPAGSVNSSAAWHDAARRTYFPQWTRPDGKACGMIWSTGADEERELRFTGGEPTFYNLYGLRLPPRKLSPGVCRQTVGGSPLYFVGARLTPAKKVPFIYCSDIFHPAMDPDDHFDLAALFAFDELDIKALVLDGHIDRKGQDQFNGGGRIPLSQMCKITGRSVPAAVGLNVRLDDPLDTLPNGDPRYLAGVELMRRVLEESDEPVAVKISTGTDLAVLFNRAPDLCRKKIRAVYFNAGHGCGGVTDEYNVLLDPVAFTRIFETGLPICWNPCFGNGRVVGDGHCNFFVLPDQRVVLEKAPIELSRFISYVLLKEASDPIAWLANGAAAEVPAKTRWMWTPPVLAHAAGRTVYRLPGGDCVWSRPERAPQGARPCAFYGYDSARVTVDPARRHEGVLTVDYGSPEPNVKVFRQFPGYSPAMGSCLRNLYGELGNCP